MRLRDFSVRTRLMAANFLMVFIPVCVLAVLGAGILTGIKFTSSTEQSELAMLWPEKGPALSVQLAVSSLRVKAARKDEHKWKDMLEDCERLEAQGIRTEIIQDGRVRYVTAGTDAENLQQEVLSRCGDSTSTMLWEDEHFTFYYVAPRSQTTILAAGDAPFLGQERPMGRDKALWRYILTAILGVAILVILLVGAYLSRLLSRQIIEPLSELRRAAAEIRRGNLDTAMTIRTQDEFGDACRDFDQMRLELKRSREQQRKYEQNRKELIAGISHDLSTPLTALKGYASGIIEGIAHTPEKQRHYVEMIYQGALTMEKLVDSLFLFSKLDLGRIPFHLEPVVLQDYFRDFVAEKCQELRDRGIDLTFQGQSTACVSIDRMQFQRVIDNLLTNSWKYRRGDRSGVRLILSDRENQLKLDFIDDGIGVGDEDLPKLFDSFYRTDPARSNVAKGSGLGLAIVKQIILGMKGTIWAEQNPAGGLVIRIVLPTIERKEHETDIDC